MFLLANGPAPSLASYAVSFVFTCLVAAAIAYFSGGQCVHSDTAVGACYVAAFALGILLLSLRQRYSGHLEHFFFGSLLAVNPLECWLLAGLALLALTLVLACWRWLGQWTFDEELALASGVPTGVLRYALILLIAATVILDAGRRRPPGHRHACPARGGQHLVGPEHGRHHVAVPRGGSHEHIDGTRDFQQRGRSARPCDRAYRIRPLCHRLSRSPPPGPAALPCKPFKHMNTRPALHSTRRHHALAVQAGQKLLWVIHRAPHTREFTVEVFNLPKRLREGGFPCTADPFQPDDATPLPKLLDLFSPKFTIYHTLSESRLVILNASVVSCGNSPVSCSSSVSHQPHTIH